MPSNHLVRRALLAATTAAAMLSAGCKDPPKTPGLQGQVFLTLLHTADIHSRLYPYNLQLTEVDAGLGLGASGAIVNTGGAARVSHVVGRERARADRVLHLDGGDSFQGAPIFNFFSGEPEIRTLSAMGSDASLVANHEFDRGALNLGIQLQRWSDFPVLAANYLFQDPSTPGASPLGDIVKPFTVFDVRGLKVGVIGMGNLSSLTSIFDTPNRLGITPLDTTETAQFYVDLLRPQVDVVVVLTHLGLDVDETMIQTTTGIDIVLGGHNHIVLQPPKAVPDCSAFSETVNGVTRSFVLYDRANGGEADIGCQTDADCGDNGYCYGGIAPVAMGTAICKQKRYCNSRNVLLAHSGAFAKYVGRLDLQLSNDPNDILPIEPNYDPIDGFELISHEYTLFPITEETPEDPVVSQLLQPYDQALDALGNLDLLVGYAFDGSSRTSNSGGDSDIGNLISTSMWLRLGIQTDFALVNTTGIRANLVPGPVTIEEMYNVFPFDNTITKIELSGVEVQEVFDFAARRSAGRGCVSQVQIAGARVVMDCTIQQCDILQCPAGQVCDPTGYVCVPEGKCASAPACTVGLYCDPMSGTCITGDPGVATHIYIGTYLDQNNHPLTCISDKDCPDNLPNQCDANEGVCYQPIQPLTTYELATSNYLGAGGSGFIVLQHNTTQNNTLVQQRDALIDYVRAGPPCGVDRNVLNMPCKLDSDCGPAHKCNPASNICDPLYTCSIDTDCNTLGKDLGEIFVCACPASASDDGVSCSTDPSKSCNGSGRCVLQQCRDDVANFQRQTCAAAPTVGIQAECTQNTTPCVAGGEQCKFLACLDKYLGNISDGRIQMVGQ